MLRGPLISLLSQGVGLIQLGAILLVIGASEATDAYFYLFSLGLIPVLILLVGLMYPSMLTELRMSKVGLARLRWITPLASILFILGGSLWLELSSRFAVALIPLVVVLSINAVFQGAAWFRAIAAEAEGEQLWISGIALPANAFATLLLVPPWPTKTMAVLAMTIGLVIGNAAIYVVMNRRKIGSSALAAAPDTASRSDGSYWFLGKAGVGYASQAVMQSVAILLPATGVTYLNIANKIVGSISATFVNALMPQIVHQHSDSPAAGRRFIRLMFPVVAATGALVVVAVQLIRPQLFLPAVIVAIWLLGSTHSAISQRMAFRFLPSNASRVSMIVIAVIVVLTIGSSALPGFTLTVILAAFAAMDCATAMLLLWLLRDRLASFMMGCGLLTVLGIWAVALLWR